MKEWLVKEPNEFEAAITFASTRNKARYLVSSMERCYYAKVLDIFGR